MHPNIVVPTKRAKDARQSVGLRVHARIGGRKNHVPASRWTGRGVVAWFGRESLQPAMCVC